jgi:crotonobetainyl-CoA:carnitine CoA-transferase CaiB-like acyl-CoA transferase
VAHPELGRDVVYPGPFAHLSATPLEYRRRPPTVGEHNAEIYETELRDGAPVPASPSRHSGNDPSHLMRDGAALADVKVLDLMWAIAGPAATRVLADYGATVVRIESTTRTDICRTVAPFREFPPGAESAVLFHNVNTGKRMMTLDLASPAGRAVFFDLVRWADVVCEAYTAGTMRTLGLDYAALRAVKPEIIMLSTCLMGQTGPLATYAGFGNLAAALTGFANLCGWPDRAPAGPFGAYTDYVAPRFSLATILAALDHRRRTGVGQHIDLAQGEASIHFLAPALLDYTVNDRVQTAIGNDDAEAAPHGVYPAAGFDRWIAIAVSDDTAFAALAGVMAEAALADDPRFASAAARRLNREALEAVVSGWTREQDAHAAEAALQAAGVAAAVVANSADLAADPQLVHREHIRELPHPDYGTTPVEGTRFRLSRTPAVIGGAAPTLGRDNQDVLATILGYDEARITELVIAGALG